MTPSVSNTAVPADTDCSRTQIDPRGPRFGASVTTVVLAAALILNLSLIHI